MLFFHRQLIRRVISIAPFFFIEERDEKGTARSHQEYAKPLLMLTGEEYERITFKDLMKRLDESLDRKYGRRPGAIFIKPDGSEQRLY